MGNILTSLKTQTTQCRGVHTTHILQERRDAQLLQFGPMTTGTGTGTTGLTRTLCTEDTLSATTHARTYMTCTYIHTYAHKAIYLSMVLEAPYQLG